MFSFCKILHIVTAQRDIRAAVAPELPVSPAEQSAQVGPSVQHEATNIIRVKNVALKNAETWLLDVFDPKKIKLVTLVEGTTTVEGSIEALVEFKTEDDAAEALARNEVYILGRNWQILPEFVSKEDD